MIALAVACAAVAAYLWLPPDPTRRLRRAFARSQSRRPRLEDLSPRQMIVLAGVAGVMISLLLGGLLGLLAGAAVAVVIVMVTRRHGQRAERFADVALTRQAPVVAEILGAIVGAGATVADALDAVARAVASPAGDHLAAVRAALLLGASPREAWAAVPAPLRPIAQAVQRSQESGAPLAHVLGTTVVDLRREHRSAVQAAARAAGVRVVAPLALCFLPAYLVIGVVPIIASLARGLFAS